MSTAQKKDEVYVVLACNNNYVPYLAVTIQSIIDTASMSRKYNINILHSKITDENCKKVSSMATKNVSIKFINVAKNIADKKLYTKHHISEETYYRALIPELLPRVNKVAYIDCDLVVVRDIAELYDVDISQYSIGAVKNFCNQLMVDYIESEIEIPYRDYFNAGVLLLNLNEFRKRKIADKFFTMAQGEKKYNLMDQDMLNILCNKSVLYLDSRWNVSWQHVFKRENEFALLEHYKEEYEKIVKDPYIVHYTTEKKAWDYKKAPLAKYFWNYANKNSIFCEYNSKKRILLVTHEMDYAGSEHSLKRVALALKKAGYIVNVWSYQQGDFAKEFKKVDIQIRIVNGDKVDQKEYVDEYKKYDLIIANTVATYKVVKAAQDIVPTIWYIREAQNIPQFFHGKGEIYETLCTAYCIYTVSEYAKEFICENYNSNVHVIHNCVDDEYKEYHCINRKKKRNEVVKFLTLGTIEERKGYDVYFRAYMQLPEEYRKKCELHFAGRTANWAKKYSQDLFEEIKSYDNIIYHGEIQDRSKLLKLIDGMDVVVVASRDESCSLVALEGAMMGKALLVTKNTGAKYIVKEENGWIVETDSVDAMKEAYMRICDSKKILSQMGECARKEYLETSTFDIFNDNIVKMAQDNIFSSNKVYKRKIARIKRELKPMDMGKYPRALVTYDIFDTMLTRMTATPKGVFTLMQYYLTHDKKYNNKSKYLKDNFYELRLNAEACARNALCTREKAEITLNDIYSTLNLTDEMSYGTIQELKKLEEDVEYLVSLGIKENVRNFLERMKNKDKLAYLSDMYLEREFVRRLLYKEDVRLSNHKIYISSMYNKTKSSGSFYNFVKNENGIEFSAWKHTGDNLNSDVANAKKLGINAELYGKSALLPWEEELLSGKENDVHFQLALGASKNARINYEQSVNTAFNVGTAIGGVVLYPYVRWIIDKANHMGIKRLYFVARDGFVLKNIADIIIEKNQYEIRTSYVYGSRQCWRMPAISSDEREFERLFNESLPHFVNNVADIADMFQITQDILVEYLPNVYKVRTDNLTQTDVQTIKSALVKNEGFRKYICAVQSEKKERAIKYIQQEVDCSDENFAFVELNGSGFTQYCLSNLMNTYYDGRICTFFLKLNSVNKYTNEKIKFISFMPNNLKAAHVLEALCRAPHGQTIDYYLSEQLYVPVLDDAEGTDLVEYGYMDYVRGVEEFSKYLADAEKQTGLKITTCALTIKGLEYVVKHPNSEILDFIGDIPFGATGREKEIGTFAPRLSDTQIKRIYYNREKIQKVYSGASIDMSLMRCTEKQMKLKEIYEKKGRRKKQEKKNTSARDGLTTTRFFGKNYLSNSDFEVVEFNTDRENKISEAMKNTLELRFDNATQYYKVGDYIYVEKGNGRIKLSNPVRITDVTEKGVCFWGRPVNVEVGDVVKASNIPLTAEVQTIFDDWKVYSKNNDGKIAKLKSGILIEKGYTEQMSFIRFGRVLEIPEILKNTMITCSIQCEQVINDIQFNVACASREIGLQTAGLNDAAVTLSHNGKHMLTTFVPQDATHIRIMLQIPTRNAARILVEQMKLEKGEKSSMNNLMRHMRHIPEFFSVKKILGAVQCVKDSGLKYTIHRIGEHLGGKE